MMHSPKTARALYLLLGALTLSFNTALLAQTVKPATSSKSDEIPIVDPFARNVNRPAQYGAVPVAKARGEKKGEFAGTDSNYQYDEDFAKLPDLRNYRVLSITTKNPAKKPELFGPDLTMPALGTSARKVYLRIHSNTNLLMAKQYVWDFFELHKNYIDANFVIRKELEAKQAVYRVDMGPFTSERHAQTFCTVLIPELSNNCTIIKEFQSHPEHSTFRNTAAVGLSNSMIQQLLSINKNQDAGNLYSSGFDVAEGDTLGKSNFVILKINNRGIYLGNEAGKLFLLPADIIPSPYAGDDAPSEK